MRIIVFAFFAFILVLPVGALSAAAPPAPAETRSIPPLIGIGPGPLAEIRNITDQEYNRSYMQAVYQQNADIASIATCASIHASDPDIRVISRKIAVERLSVNEDIKRWYMTFANRTMPKPNMDRSAGLQMALAYFPGEQFDCAYTSVMIGLMLQSQDAAEEAQLKSTIPELVQQARIDYKTNANEIKALQKWQETGRLK